jgi:hypothetical protein
MTLCLFTVACAESTDPPSGAAEDASTDAGDEPRPENDAGAVDLGDTLADSGMPDALVDAVAAPDMEPLPPEDVHCFDEALTVVAEGEGFNVTGPRYQLYIERDRDRAEEVGRMLEAAWFAFEAYFGYAPDLAPDERLLVKFYSDADRWRAGMAADGIDSANIQAGGYYDLGRRIAYLYRQPTLFYTDTLTLHEAGHQFHRIGSAGQNSLPGWYVEGVVEYLSRHDWDGRCVRLGVRPLLSREDVPARALDNIETNGIDLTAVIGGETFPPRPILWALYSFLETGLDDAAAEGFHALRTALDGGDETEPLALFEEELGDPTALEGPLLDWLREAQLPMRDIYLEWTHLGPDTVRGHGANFSFALFKAPLSHLTFMAIPASERWGLGVIIEYADNANFTGVVLSDSGEVSTFEAIDGAATWWGQGNVPLGPNPSMVSVELSRNEEGTATIRFGDTPFTFPTTLPPILGLVINDSDVLFEGLRWTSADPP